MGLVEQGSYSGADSWITALSCLSVTENEI